jgi:hypothetical protein
MLTQSFFEGKTVEELANALLGCELIHESPEGITAGIPFAARPSAMKSCSARRGMLISISHTECTIVLT